MSDRVAAVSENPRVYVEDAYQHMCALFTLFGSAGDTPIPASHVHQLLKPVKHSLDKATDD